MKKSLLMIPDIKNWSTDKMADGIISVLSDKYDITKKFAEEEDGINIDQFDIIYYMISGYIPKNLSKDHYRKIRTSIHGGPGSIGQIDEIRRNDDMFENLKISYVSKEVENRIENDDEVKIKNKSLLKKNKYYTPHGISIDKNINYNSNDVDELVCGWAGWLKYLTIDQSSAQYKHRRGNWIIKSVSEENVSNVKLEIASGLVNDDIANKPENINIQTYEGIEINDFYRKINTYLIPDLRAGGPLPALEAALFNIPLITTDCGLLGSEFIDKEHGILISNYDEFINAIKWMKNNPDERRKMGLRWGNHVRTHRTWKAVRQYWYDFLEGN